MSTPVVIAICGARRAGKDTVANILERAYGYQPMKFARYLKDMIKAGFGFSEQEVEGYAKDIVHPVYQVTPRAIMQYIGTDVMQYGLQTLVPGIGRNIWARRLLFDMQSMMENKGMAKFVISDMRFLHEYDELKSAALAHGYRLCIIKISRQNTTCMRNNTDDTHNINNNDTNETDDTENLKMEDSHISEREWGTIPHDYYIRNDASCDSLERDVRAFIDKLV